MNGRTIHIVYRLRIDDVYQYVWVWVYTVYSIYMSVALLDRVQCESRSVKTAIFIHHFTVFKYTTYLSSLWSNQHFKSINVFGASGSKQARAFDFWRLTHLEFKLNLTVSFDSDRCTHARTEFFNYTYALAIQMIDDVGVVVQIVRLGRIASDLVIVAETER